MTTPDKLAIHRLAQEKYHAQNKDMAYVSATDLELREDNLWTESRNELMTDTARSQHLAYLESEAVDIGYRLIKKARFASGQKPETKVYPFAFDWVEAQKSNILVSGTNSTGKSRLACKLAHILKTVGWRIICFDNSSVWKKISDLEICITISEHENYYQVPILEGESVIYDISALVPTQQKELVDFVLLDLWNNRDNDNFSYVMVILEESQLYCRNLRGNLSQHLMRIFSAGRNKQIRCMAITVDLALIDPSFIRLCQQRYHGRLGIEMGGKRRFKQYYGKEWMETATQLDLGKFIYLNKNKLQQIKVPLFEAKTKPQNYNDYLVSLQPTPQKKKGFWAKVLERLQ